MISLPEMVLRLALAVVFGSVIGLEREFHAHRAGMRTNALVSLGSALFTLISAYGFLGLLTLSHVQVDPTRVASYVVAGIGFLGGGTIVVRKTEAQGLTTAAAIWTVAAIGMACGIGFYWEALAVTVLTLVVLRALRFLEHRLIPAQSQIKVHIHLKPQQKAGTLLGQIYDVCLQQGLVVETIQTHEDEGETLLEINCHFANVTTALHVLEGLQALEGVSQVKLDLQELNRLNHSQHPKKGTA